MATPKRRKTLKMMPPLFDFQRGLIGTAMDLVDGRLKPQINKLRSLQYTVFTFTEGLGELDELREDLGDACVNGLYEIIDDVTSAFDDVYNEMGRLLTGCCPNPFSLVLKRFLINLRRTPGDVKTRPSGSSS